MNRSINLFNGNVRLNMRWITERFVCDSIHSLSKQTSGMMIAPSYDDTLRTEVEQAQPFALVCMLSCVID